MFLAADLSGAEAPRTGFLAGADFSHVAFFESRGRVYRDGGVAQDSLGILQRHGLTCVRLRLFTSSAAQAASDPYNSINNLDYTLPLALRVKQAGLRLLLDFHYSDTWADPGHQTKPAAWAGLTFAQLEQRMYDYNRDTLAAFQAAGAMPDIVQVGNEITAGLLWPEGRVGGAYDTSAQWSNLGRLLKAAVRGLQDAAGAQPPRLIVHLDRGGDWAGTQWFFDRLAAQAVGFDIIGQSYYPFWHGTLGDLRRCLTNAVQRYGKPVLIAETAFPWVTTNWDGTPIPTNLTAGIPAGPAGQVQFAGELAKLIQSVPGGKGLGVVWWGAEYQRLPGFNLAGFEGRSFFDSGGNLLPMADALAGLARPVLTPPQRVGGNQLRFTVPGPAGHMLDLESTERFANWATLTTVTNVGGTAVFTLPATHAPGAFFRVRQH